MHCRIEQERLKHPEIKCIPSSIWRGEFDYTIPDLALDLMRLDLLSVMPELDKLKNYFKTCSAQNKCKILLALAFKHPDINPNQLLWLAKKIDVNFSELLNVAACLGELTLFDKIIHTYSAALVANSIKKTNYWTFCLAARYGHLSLIEKIMALLPHDIDKMIAADRYRAFSLAASNGHQAVMQRFLSLAPNKLHDMLAGNGHAAFRFSAKYGQISTLEWFKQLAPEKLQHMIIFGHYSAFRYAAENGHLALMKWLIDELEIASIEEMIAANDNEAFRLAAFYQYQPMIEMLLSFLNVFFYAEKNPQYNQAQVLPYIYAHINILKNRQQALKDDSPEAIFNLSTDENSLPYFYIIRNLIERNDAQYHQDIRFLLEIPAIAQIAHIDGTTERENELFRLALYVDNQEAVALLLKIPTVRQIVEAQARESSLTDLNQGEQRRLAAAIQHYQAKLQGIGQAGLIKQLCDCLITRYQANPAIIEFENKQIILPHDWANFNALNLNDAQKQTALKAYYQHKDHSAWRYLQKPNPWMHPDALYINVEGELRWSTFEHYQDLIAILWLAVIDTEISATDGHSLMGRQAHFIDELAAIGRAHNWDNSRIDAHGQTQEYDDLEADRPSCHQGVKRRLLQSVIGHPLLKRLTKDDIKQEINQFVRDQFLSKMTRLNRQLFLDTLNQYFEELDETLPAMLLELNIARKDCDAFIGYLEMKYGQQFIEDPLLRQEVSLSLTLKAEGEPIERAHALRFASVVNLVALLKKPPITALNQLGIFAQAAAASSLDVSNRQHALDA